MERIKGLWGFHIKNINYFDEVTRIRLILLAGITLLTQILFPVLSQFMYLLETPTVAAATIIGVFALFKTLGMKFVKMIQYNLSFSNIFLAVIIFDILWIISSATYFISPKIMIWADSILGVFHVPFLWAFSNSLNNYITYFFNDTYTKFQN
jgi:hypothetical protein